MRTVIAVCVLLMYCAAAPPAAAVAQFANNHRWGDNLSEQDRREVWPTFRRAILDFQNTGDRPAFLAACRTLSTENPLTGYGDQLRGIIGPLEREAAAAPPAAANVPPASRTLEQRIEVLVYDLRETGGRQFSDPGYPDLRGPAGEGNAYGQLIDIGRPAIPWLLRALDDDTPTRTVAWQRSFYPVYFVLRRQDLAMKCLEAITGCEFYDEGATYIHLYMDDPARRQSAIDNARKWHAVAGSLSQADGVRKQLELCDGNIALNGGARLRMLQLLGALEGPEGILEELYRLDRDERTEIHGSVGTLLREFDRPYLVQTTFERFWSNESRDTDFGMLSIYGDQNVYREISERFVRSGKLHPGPFSPGEQGERAAKYGLNWSIPILADLLRFREVTGSRTVNGVNQGAYSTGDEAIQLFEEMTGYQSGYEFAAPFEERQAAIVRAYDWWLATGKNELAEKIAADHPPVESPGDVLLTREQSAAMLAGLTTEDIEIRRDTISRLDVVYSAATRRALLGSLATEPLPAQRQRTLDILMKHPVVWELLPIARRYVAEKDVATQLKYGEYLLAIKKNYGNTSLGRRLETQAVALQLIREMLQRDDLTVDVRSQATSIVGK